MTRSLILPERYAPSNLHLRPSVKTRFVENDVFDVCRQLKGIDPSLYVIQLIEGDEHAFAIMESCQDGVERLVFKVKELDGRVVEKMRYIMAVPLQERLRIAEAEHHTYEEQRKDDELEELYERFGGDMWKTLADCGFSGPRGVSYAKRGRKFGRGR